MAVKHAAKKKNNAHAPKLGIRQININSAAKQRRKEVLQHAPILSKVNKKLIYMLSR